MGKFKPPQVLSRKSQPDTTNLPISDSATQHLKICSSANGGHVKQMASNQLSEPSSLMSDGARRGAVVIYYKVLYTKRNANKKRKNKTFADGVLEAKEDTTCVLYSEEGRVISKSKVKGCINMPEGADLIIGNWEVEIDACISETSFRSGQCFVQASSTLPSCTVTKTNQPAEFKKPFRVVQQHAALRTRPALFDPMAEDALHLNKGRDKEVAVVMDPYLSKNLRPHQREGLSFLYGCVMGLKSPTNLGAILADDMGLGKTLQIICLIWTLLKQGPKGVPAARRAIIVAPATLVQNWAAEFRKWLGDERLPVMVLQAGQESTQQVIDFKFGTLHKVMIAGYETLRKHCSELTGFCDLMVCDEGHRLKAAGGSKTMDSLLALQCPRRIIVTGTPVQNNLEEFCALVSFVNPHAFSASSFRTVFGDPISRAQDKNATAEEISLGKERSAALKTLIDGFMLRRTKDVIAKLLPALQSYAVFCPASVAQVGIYQKVLASCLVKGVISGAAGFDTLSAITLLRKICNHPLLVSEHDINSSMTQDELDRKTDLPSGAVDATQSGKMKCLVAVLRKAIAIGDRVVVVSNSVQALILIQKVCQQQDWNTVRIDGSMSSEQRHSVVVNFNQYNIGQICLLSTRAGGAGLNLIGANRLVLYDSDWNPAMDLQAMARIWRDGQKRPCVVYRLLTTGSIDEKIFQRQRMKCGLASFLATKKDSTKGGFSKEELRELFTLDTSTMCSTQVLLPDSFKDCSVSVTDPCLQAALQEGPSNSISFVYHDKEASSLVLDQNESVQSNQPKEESDGHS